MNSQRDRNDQETESVGASAAGGAALGAVLAFTIAANVAAPIIGSATGAAAGAVLGHYLNQRRRKHIAISSDEADKQRDSPLINVNESDR